MHIVYIHGANSTPASFNYIKGKLPMHTYTDITYANDIPLMEIVHSIYESLPHGPIYIIGHSLGGVIAVALSQLNKYYKNKQIEKIFTISSPFGGSKAADYLRWFFPHYRLFADISTVSPIIKAATSIGAVVPTKNIVTCKGSMPLLNGENDGVVSVESQMALVGAEKEKQNLNHFEVLLDDGTVRSIQQFFEMA
jgi:triacylglycerol esterase/lipase EstA (alpha/beta hydrolase family)